MNLIALLAIIATANNISASFAKRASTAALLVGIKAQQAVTTTIKKYPKTAAVVGGWVALNIIGMSAGILISENGLNFAQNEARKSLTPEELDILHKNLARIRNIKCHTCLNKEQELLKVRVRDTQSTEKSRITDSTLRFQCIVQQNRGSLTLPRSCETCNPSKKSNTK